jgi:phage shock protein A
MATDNKSLTIYLETEILDALTAYCLDNGIVRKDKTTPILATGAVDLMKQALGLSPTLTNTVQVRDEQTEKKLENLEARLETFEDAIAKVENEIDDLKTRVEIGTSSPATFSEEQLRELIQEKLQGRQGFMTTSNLWKMLGLQGNKPEQEKAEVILLERGCLKQKGSSTDGSKTGWIIP